MELITRFCRIVVDDILRLKEGSLLSDIDQLASVLVLLVLVLVASVEVHHLGLRLVSLYSFLRTMILIEIWYLSHFSLLIIVALRSSCRSKFWFNGFYSLSMSTHMACGDVNATYFNISSWIYPSRIKIHITGSLVKAISPIIVILWFCTDDFSYDTFWTHFKSFWLSTYPFPFIDKLLPPLSPQTHISSLTIKIIYSHMLLSLHRFVQSYPSKYVYMILW